MTRTRSRIAVAVAVAVCAAFLTGCFVIKSTTAAQIDLIGDVEITTVACFTNGTTCSDFGNSGSGAPPGSSRAMLAYRLPDGVTAPESFESADGAITMFPDGSYTAELQAKAAPPAGQHWVGYRSPDLPPTANAGDHTFKPRFGLPQGSDGAPFKGPFRYQVVSGRTDPGNAPVNCGSDPEGPGGRSTAICIDSPSPRGEYQKDKTLDTRDLGLKGGDITVRQGESVDAPFTAEYAGASDPSGTFGISAGPSAHDVLVAASPARISPASDSTTPVTVKANALPTAPPGVYSVTLRAHGPNGIERRRTVKLTVELGRPYNLTLPQVTGTAAVGKVVTCERGDWSGSPSGYTRQWTRDGAPIAGATADTYTLTEEDGARLIACTATATNAVGQGTAAAGHVRVAQHGGSDVSLNRKAKLTARQNGTYTLDTGITVACPPRLPVPCAGGTRIDADSVGVASRAFTVASGKKLSLTLRLGRRGTALLKKDGRLNLVAVVTTRNHGLERVTSRKTFSVRAR